MNSKNFKPLITSVVISALITGCAAVPEWSPEELEPEQRTFGVLTRQHPPEPVYNRLTWVRPPEVKPPREIAPSGAPLFFQIVRLELKDATLEEASLALAGSAKYRSYCSSLVAGKRIDFDRIGTIDELAAELAMSADIDIVVDHENREVRFLAKKLQSEKPGEVVDNKVS